MLHNFMASTNSVTVYIHIYSSAVTQATLTHARTNLRKHCIVCQPDTQNALDDTRHAQARLLED